MIVAPLFEGDADHGLMDMQHGSYHSAIGRILDAHNRVARFMAVASGGGARGWSSVTTCDHRTLQDVHDILAAAWRYRTDVRQLPLPLASRASADEPAAAWLSWLETELTGWFDAPDLVRQLHEILTAQNGPRGYAAEARMAYGLTFERFSDVPWLAETKATVAKCAEGADVQPEKAEEA